MVGPASKPLLTFFIMKLLHKHRKIYPYSIEFCHIVTIYTKKEYQFPYHFHPWYQTNRFILIPYCIDEILPLFGSSQHLLMVFVCVRECSRVFSVLTAKSVCGSQNRLEKIIQSTTNATTTTTTTQANNKRTAKIEKTKKLGP